MDHGVDYQKNIDLMKKLKPLCDEYDEVFNECNTDTPLYNILKKTMSSTVKEILLEMYCADETDRPKDKAMPLINQLAENNWLYEQCLDIYRICTTSEAIVGSIAKENMKMFSNYNRALSGIHSLLDVNTQDNCKIALKLLMTLMTDNGQKIQAVDRGGLLQGRIDKASERCFTTLFSPVFENYKNFINNPEKFRHINENMSQFKKRFIELQPYACIIRDSGNAKAYGNIWLALPGLMILANCVLQNRLTKLILIICSD